MAHVFKSVPELESNTNDERQKNASVFLHYLAFIFAIEFVPLIQDRLNLLSVHQVHTSVERITVLPTRFIWFVGYAYLLRAIYWRWPNDLPRPRWQNATVLGWGGMRGGVTLAAALALPAATNAGGAFPFRNLVIFLSFSVLLVTLVGQGLTFPIVIRALGITGDGRAEREEAKARFKAAVAGLTRLEQLATEDWVDPDEAEAVRAQLQEQAQHYRAAPAARRRAGCHRAPA